MPQITIEYSASLADLDWEPTALLIHQAAVEIAAAGLSACKTRLVRLDRVLIADGEADQAMAACRIGLMGGRSLDQRTALSERALEILSGAVAPAGLSVQASAEVFELNDTYRKTTVEPR